MPRAACREQCRTTIRLVGAFYALGNKKPPYLDLAPLIERVVVNPGEDGPQIELVGEIARMVRRTVADALRGGESVGRELGSVVRDVVTGAADPLATTEVLEGQRELVERNGLAVTTHRHAGGHRIDGPTLAAIAALP